MGYRWHSLLAWLLALALPASADADGPCDTAPPAGIAASTARASLVLIIDDLGHRRRQGLAMVNLPGKLNLAILPHTPFGPELAEAGFAAGKEILLHAPMSNAGGVPLGAGGLTAALPREEFDRILAENINAVPHIRGVNNHMGSELTTQPLQMGWVMQALLRRDLYFIDSRTNAATVAAQTAADYQVPHLSRSVFLDNETAPAAISAQFDRLLALAERDGVAVGIGHPYPSTAEFLAAALPALKCRGIELALVSEILARQAQRERPGGGPGSEPDFDAVPGHVSLGLGYGVLAEMEDAGGEDRVGAALEHPGDQVIEVANAP
ncbi:divergent polysaccharide deacetylase family protein [Seongchinamella sediminis]|uniref:Divergent polysaccharide deacetylase family protein n=1 Tax=Seongchinamella sediminis TaxID=2283635 RepID=A0A3L7E107_9GAMM|nr:divergent polysaccharide deacetylase family protein [Seongchinamella sediminis]